jgi:hypothetical protein
MTHTYKYEFVDGHIIAVVDQRRFLIDTGAPFSVADASPIEFAGGSYRAQKTYMGVSPESLSRNVGTSIDTLVGADILNQYDIFIDPTTQTLDVSENELPLTGQALELDDVMGIPIIEVMVGEDKVRMFFDTGAKLSYLDPQRINGFESIGTETDFYPGIGDFSTNVFDVPIMLAGETLFLRVGNLPALLQMSLMMADTGGILGTAILRTHKVIFAPRRKTLTLQRIVG